jgi:glycosyltransferase involved in cell wall biosynthesis
MRIGFDAKRALNNASGLGNYSRNLLNALMRDFRDEEYVLFSPKANEDLLNLLDGDFKVIFPETKHQRVVSAGLIYWLDNAYTQLYIYLKKIGLWRSWGIKDDLVRERVKLYHGLSNEIPFDLKKVGIPSVVTVHDLIFLKHKEQYPFIDRLIYNYKTRYAAHYADRVIAVSTETKSDLIEHYKIPESRIVVIPPPIDNAFAQPVRQNFKVKNLLPAKYILNVSSFYPRKNQKALIEAFDLIKSKVEEDLVLVGDAGGEQKNIEALINKKGLNQRVTILTGISNEDLPSVYASASAFVFPSLFEGFGMPIVEALFSKVPVVATKGGCFEEAGGRNSLYVNSESPEEIAEAILKAISDTDLRNKMIEAGYGHAQTMSDTIIAKKTMQVYKEITGR